MPTTKSLQEVIIAAHFQAPISLNIMDLADWAQNFSNDFPIVQQLPPLNPVTFPVPGPQQMQIQFLPVDAAVLPRMLLRTADGRYSVQLQNDRFAFGWHRTEPIGEPAEYPGFEAFQPHWKKVLERFEVWTEGRFRQRPGHRMIEMTYSNAVPLERDDKKIRLSEIFKFVQPGKRRLAAFGASWIEPVGNPDEGTSPKGVVTANVSIGAVAPALQALLFTFSGLGSVVMGEQSDHILNDVHAKIREMFEGSIAADAD